MGWLKRVLGGSAPPPFPPVDFVSIDVETASSERHTICQIGIVGFHRGVEVYAEKRLVNPRCAFLPVNVQVHGLTAAHVAAADDFVSVYPWLRVALEDRLVVSHSPFDMQALAGACARHQRPPFGFDWVNSLEVARQVWPELSSHRLASVARHIGADLEHHDALSDARAAGLILVAAMQLTGQTAAEILAAPARQGAFAAGGSTKLGRDGGAGPLSGEVFAMTGTFDRGKEAMADLIAAHGGAVRPSVTKTTTVLLLGAQDPSTFAGKDKSAKHLKAELLGVGVWTEAELMSRIGVPA